MRRNFSHLFGHAGYVGYAGVWDDTQTWMANNLGPWLAGAEPVDVPEGEAGVQALLELAPSLVGKKVLLSARAQAAAWAVWQRSWADLEYLEALALDAGETYGEQMLARVAAEKQIMIAQATELERASEAALQQGVSQADANDWLSPAEAQRTQAAVPAWVIVVVVAAAAVTIAVVAGLIIAGTVIAALAASGFKYAAVREAADAVQGNPQAMAGLFSQYLASEADGGVKGKFPWGWVVGIGVAAVSGLLVIAWAEGTLGRWMEQARGAGASKGTSMERYSF